MRFQENGKLDKLDEKQLSKAEHKCAGLYWLRRPANSLTGR